MQKIIVLAFLFIMTVACGHKKDAKTFEKALEAETGTEWTIVKLDTEKGEYVVYRDEATGRFSAFNLEKWDRKTMSTTGEYFEKAVKGVDYIGNVKEQSEYVEQGYNQDIYDTYYVDEEFYDEDCDCYYTESVEHSEYVGTEWVDTSYWYTFYTGGGFRFENTSSASKDLETMAALEEQVAEAYMTNKFTSEFSMSANRAQELAKLANRYQKLENTRELTSSEKDQFALDALGVSFSQVENALKQKAEGKETAYADLLEKASAVNNTTPEKIGQFFDELLIGNVE